MPTEPERVSEAKLEQDSRFGSRARSLLEFRAGTLLDWPDVDKGMLLAGIPVPLLIAAAIRVTFILFNPRDEPYLSRGILRAILTAILVYTAALAVLTPVWFVLRRKSPNAPRFVQATLFLFFITSAIAAYFVGHFSTPIMGASVAGAIAVLLLFDQRVARPAIAFGFITLFGPVPFMALRVIPYSPLYVASPFIGGDPPLTWLTTTTVFSVLIMSVPIWILTSVLDRWRERDEEIHRLARLDGLTEIANRRYFLERLEAELARAERYKSSVALLLLDLDHFKRINDRFGHQIGDVALRHVAALLTSDVLRRIDVVGRYGGEEFAVMLPETELEGAMIVAERVRAALEARTIPLEDGQVVGLTASIGLAVFPTPGVSSLDALVRRADDALYRAKDNGRNRVESEPLEDRPSARPNPPPF
jgi:diguanylate cyclase (GGDEF)-like protein